ncbi:hypothetical protein ACQKGL_19210 [Ensifer adhaerens]|uniref:hypothetical protein n=1 Tax=Ensifer adhaerens TaxID=106592 RepID=UPI003D031883
MLFRAATGRFRLAVSDVIGVVVTACRLPNLESRQKKEAGGEAGPTTGAKGARSGVQITSANQRAMSQPARRKLIEERHGFVTAAVELPWPGEEILPGWRLRALRPVAEEDSSVGRLDRNK